jgi:hypothetical protein
MAKRKRRPKAGPPPVHNPRKAAPAAAQAEKTRPAPARGKGEPAPPSFRGVLIRSVVVAVLFYPVLVYLLDEPPAAAAVVVGFALLAMLPLGVVLDRMRYRRELKRWQERHGGSARR